MTDELKTDAASDLSASAGSVECCRCGKEFAPDPLDSVIEYTSSTGKRIVRAVCFECKAKDF